LQSMGSAVINVQVFHFKSWRSAAGFGGDEPIVVDDPITSMSLRGFVEDVLRQSGLEDACRNDKSDPDHERLANLGELVSSAQQFEQDFELELELDGSDHTPSLSEKLLAFLERISLVSDVDAVDSDQGAVTLMTLHAAKGLEYPAVAMIGVEDGLLPHDRANSSDSEMEEERRLCFVGVTRAMQKLYLTHARYRTVFGQSNVTIPSRFFREMPEDCLEEIDATLVDYTVRTRAAQTAFQATLEADPDGREEQLRELYETAVDETPLCLNLIYVESEAEAEKVRDRVDSGEDFGAVAAEVSAVDILDGVGQPVRVFSLAEIGRAHV